jgi:hypothetical protein
LPGWCPDLPATIRHEKPVVLLAAAMLAACATHRRRLARRLRSIAWSKNTSNASWSLSPMTRPPSATRVTTTGSTIHEPGISREGARHRTAFLDRARGIDRRELSPASRITYDIFVSERELALEGRSSTKSTCRSTR